MSYNYFFLSMMLYNATFGLMIIVTVILGVIAVLFALKKTSHSGQLISGILAFLWLWVGIVYGFLWCGFWILITFREAAGSIPGFGYFYGVIFTLQGVLFWYYGVYHKFLSFKFKSNLLGVTGFVLIIFAIAFYWYVGVITGYPFPFYPVFGTAPAPVVILTVGLFLWADKRILPILLLIPTIQGLFGFMPSLGFGIYADIVMFLSAFICIYLIHKHWIPLNSLTPS
ncbi:MAG: DUF6064 family protein [Promethearchaeota archaeon]